MKTRHSVPHCTWHTHTRDLRFLFQPSSPRDNMFHVQSHGKSLNPTACARPPSRPLRRRPRSPAWRRPWHARSQPPRRRRRRCSARWSASSGRYEVVGGTRGCGVERWRGGDIVSSKMYATHVRACTVHAHVTRVHVVLVTLVIVRLSETPRTEPATGRLSDGTWCSRHAPEKRKIFGRSWRSHGLARPAFERVRNLASMRLRPDDPALTRSDRGRA